MIGITGAALREFERASQQEWIETNSGHAEAARVISEAAAHLADARVGSESEIFDAEPPHTPRGCIAQAWGVAELLRVVLEKPAE